AASAIVNTNSSGIATSPIPAANGTAGSYSVTASVSGVAPPANFSLTNISAVSSSNIFGNTAPTSFYSDASVEVGVKFRSDVAGTVTGVRYYKNGTDHKTHTGSLWFCVG